MLNNYDQEEKWSYYIHCKLSDNYDYRYLRKRTQVTYELCINPNHKSYFLSQALLSQIIWVSLYEKRKPVSERL